MRDDVSIGDATFSTDLPALCASDEVDVIVEAIGGIDLAVEISKACLRSGKPLVTANKAVIAEHGNELFPLAAESGVTIGIEATVAGGVPIVAALGNSLAANDFRWLAGIINGTSNYILTAMAERGEAFANALADAQRLGYAEADPTFDVEGIDAAHKLSILLALAFDAPFAFEHVYCEGIGGITPEDIGYAKELGYSIKHLGFAKRTANGIEARVQPALVPNEHVLAHIGGVVNAVVVDADAAGPTIYGGAGAGALPTASAVVADLIALARGSANLAVADGRPTASGDVRILPIGDTLSSHYLRIPSLDRPGVFARVATILSEHGVSIEAAIQREQAIAQRDEGEAWVPIVVLTQPVVESEMVRVLEEVQALPEIVDSIRRIRVAPLDHD